MRQNILLIILISAICSCNPTPTHKQHAPIQCTILVGSPAKYPVVAGTMYDAQMIISDTAIIEMDSATLRGTKKQGEDTSFVITIPTDTARDKQGKPIYDTATKAWKIIPTQQLKAYKKFVLQWYPKSVY